MCFIINGDKTGCGKRGYYLAASGDVIWDGLYAAIVKALHKQGIIYDGSVVPSSGTALRKMAEGLGTDTSLVPI
ncbi:NAD dependent epimerase/dehydratase family protein [Colletotrichum tofieldiae]|nr:NAD dependent epimerase/dehydratase family protein [Colletotrichum tofieldiae]